MSLHRPAAVALGAVSRRLAVTPPAISLTSPSSRSPSLSRTQAVSPSHVLRAAVHDSSRRPQASNKGKNEPAHAGSFARTDDSITVEYPEEHELPSSVPITGAARHPTLSTFSLDGKVSVVTGGARGLGLVMGQGLVVSGADLAIVDLNSE